MIKSVTYGFSHILGHRSSRQSRHKQSPPPAPYLCRALAQSTCCITSGGIVAVGIDKDLFDPNSRIHNRQRALLVPHTATTFFRGHRTTKQSIGYFSRYLLTDLPGVEIPYFPGNRKHALRPKPALPAIRIDQRFGCTQEVKESLVGAHHLMNASPHAVGRYMGNTDAGPYVFLSLSISPATISMASSQLILTNSPFPLLAGLLFPPGSNRPVSSGT